jgi:hypothetical protein
VRSGAEILAAVAELAEAEGAARRDSALERITRDERRPELRQLAAGIAELEREEAAERVELARGVPPFMRSRPLDRIPPPAGLTPRWYALRYHPRQWALWNSPARFCVVPAGRRSGKTEIGKRRLVVGALAPPHPDARYFAAAPTWQQAKRIWWADLKALSPPELVADKSEGELWIKYVTGATVQVVGLDVPARIEGTPWDGGVLDEYANMSENVWAAHLRPIMAERGGWCWFIGVPEGRNHYYRLYAEARRREQSGDGEWATFTWWSEDILPPAEVEQARREMDDDLFEQEFHASFRSFRGRAYKPFDEKTHTAPLVHRWDPDKPLVFCFDFNVEPGAAAVAQEMRLPSGHVGTAIIGQVHIPYDSDTVAVCRRLGRDWRGQRAPIVVYGDATGGQRHTAAIRGDDWKLVRGTLREEFPGVDIVLRVPEANPPERKRVNAMNARLRAADGAIRLMVDAAEAPAIVQDLEGVRFVEGGSGEIAKKGPANAGLTHWTDAIGYYVAARFPVRSGGGGAGGPTVPVAVGGE